MTIKMGPATASRAIGANSAWTIVKKGNMARIAPKSVNARTAQPVSRIRGSASVNGDGRAVSAANESVRKASMDRNVSRNAVVTSIILKCATHGRERAFASLDGMICCARGPALCSNMARDVILLAIAPTMPCAHQSMANVFVQLAT